MVKDWGTSIILTLCMIIGFCHVNRKLKVMELHKDSCIRGFHICNELWTAVLGEVLLTQRESHDVADLYAVAVKKHSGETVGHLPRKYQDYVACL